MDAAIYERMPEQLTLRQTEVADRTLVTTLTDARSVTPLDLDALYQRRWHVEPRHIARQNLMASQVAA